MGTGAPDAEAVRSRLLGAWPDDTPPELVTLEPDEIDAETAGAAAGLVIAAPPDHPQSEVLGLLGLFEEASVPVLALLTDRPGPKNAFEFAGALVERIEAETDRIVAALRGQLSRQKEIDHLRREMALSNRFQGGLRGEIARMQEELQLAAMVQREFLPRTLPALHGISFGALWRPVNFVSGDIYDVIRLDEDHVGLFLADAVGHGIPAALMSMVICRSLVCKEIEGSTYRIIPPAEVLARLNTAMISRQRRTSRFATAVYGVLNCRTRVLRIAGAGHPPPIILHGNGDVSEIETPGGLLGVFEDETYGAVDVELGVNDRVVIYSDGFEQAFPCESADPYARRLPNNHYRMEFESLASIFDAEEMVETVRQRLNDHAGSLHQVDDLTMVCARIGPLGAPAPDTEPANLAATE